MLRFSSSCWLLALAFTPLFAHAQETAEPPVEGEYLVRWSGQSAPRVLAPGVNPAPWQQSSVKSQISAQMPEARVTRTFAGSGWSLVKTNGNSLTRLARLLGSANVTPNFKRRIAKVPNDPQFGAQWHWPRIKAAEAWNLKTGSSNVVVAVLDTGVDLTHPDLKANLWKNSKEIAGNGIDDDNNGYKDDVYGLNAIDPTQTPQDANGHGTHCAGLIGAAGNNETNVAGANWTVKIMALRFLGEGGTGNDADAIECLEYAVKMKQRGVNLRVISNSWSGPEVNPALESAFRLAEKAGILNVCAAGNGVRGGNGRNIDTSAEYPASYTLNSILSVAASDENDARAISSNYGLKSVDLSAPGTAILSLKKGGGTREDSGTSMATPIVAGAAALVAAREPALTNLQIKTRLLSTVDRVAALKGLMVSGGRLNLHRALSNATLRISGLIYRKNGTSRVPLAGAIVKLNGKTIVSTGRDGKYLLPDIAPGSHTVSASLRGYTFAPITLAMPRPSGTSGAPNAVADLEASAVPTTLYQISGRATNSSGTGQQGVSIFVSGIPNAVAVTDSSGNYKISDRAAGTYSLRAQGADMTWQPASVSVALPAPSGNAGAPNSITNFSAGVVDRQAPQIVISSPIDGARLTPSSPTASGNASDVSGNSQIYFQLRRTIDSDFAYYDWTTQRWTNDSGAAGIQGVQSVSGTSANWSKRLPTLSAGSYSLRVWGRDLLGNESTGEADALTYFEVSSTTSSSAPSSVSGASSASGGNS
jgi:subtilisin family serine protease